MISSYMFSDRIKKWRFPLAVSNSHNQQLLIITISMMLVKLMEIVHPIPFITLIEDASDLYFNDNIFHIVFA